MLGMGCLLILTSIIVNAISYRIKGVAQHEALARAGRAKSTRRPSPLKGIILALAAGVLLGGFVPLMERSRQGDLGLGPYAAGFLFAFGVFFSTFVYEIFFVNLPVEGEPVELGAYLSGTHGTAPGGSRIRVHLVRRHDNGVGERQRTGKHAGAADAAVFCCPRERRVLAALWGIVVFREFRDGDIRVKVLGILMLVLLLCGMAMVDLAPVLLPRD